MGVIGVVWGESEKIREWQEGRLKERSGGGRRGGYGV